MVRIILSIWLTFKKIDVWINKIDVWINKTGVRQCYTFSLFWVTQFILKLCWSALWHELCIYESKFLDVYSPPEFRLQYGYICNHITIINALFLKSFTVLSTQKWEFWRCIFFHLNTSSWMADQYSTISWLLTWGKEGAPASSICRLFLRICFSKNITIKINLKLNERWEIGITWFTFISKNCRNFEFGGEIIWSNQSESYCAGLYQISIWKFPRTWNPLPLW